MIYLLPLLLLGCASQEKREPGSHGCYVNGFSDSVTVKYWCECNGVKIKDCKEAEGCCE